MGVWYRTGTVAVTNGSPAVVGTGTLWTSQSSVGDIFVGPDGLNYEVSSITDDTHIGIKQVNGTAGYAGATLSAQVYAIIRNFTSTLPAQLASQLAAMMTAWHVTTDELTAWLSGSGTTTVHDSVGNAYNVQTPAALNATLSGRLSKSVAGNANVTLNSVEASNLFIELTGTLTGNINVIVPNSARSYFVANLTSGAFTVTVKTAAGTGVLVPQSGRVLLECDATNVIDPLAGKATVNNVAPDTHAATSKTTPVDTDELPLADSAASFTLKKLTWANLKSAIASYLSGIAFSIGGVTPAAGAFTTLNASGVTLPWGGTLFLGGQTSLGPNISTGYSNTKMIYAGGTAGFQWNNQAANLALATLDNSGNAAFAGSLSVTGSLAVVPSLNGAQYHLDAQLPITLANSGFIDIPSFSGMMIVNNQSTGGIGLWMCGGGGAALISGSPGISPTYNAGTHGYTLYNSSGASMTIGVFIVRTRAAG